MCGIIGYIGHQKASDILLHGLQQVEYRGYDSAGMAVSGAHGIGLIKDVGKVNEIHSKHDFLKLEGGIGIAHTRWATHGIPCERNAHPHTDCAKKIAVVHNGIIENHRLIRDEVVRRGHKLKSETDTELIAHLIEDEMKAGKDAEAAVKSTISRLEGTYALGILIEGEKRIYMARRHAPLVIGKGKSGEMYFASDILALLRYTKDFILLNEGDIAAISPSGAVIWGTDGKEVVRAPMHVDWNEAMAKKEGHDHFMLKEILEQPLALASALGADVSEGAELLRKAKHPAIVACGTSYYAGLMLQYLLHRQSRDADAYVASEYGSWRSWHEDLVIAISQSGETADTLAAVRMAKKSNIPILAITNVVGSSLAREADATIFLSVGPEIEVVATKTFTGQLMVIYKLAYTLNNDEHGLKQLAETPARVQELLDFAQKPMKVMAKELATRKDFFFIARGVGYPCALEAALKLKEITYLHAEAYPGGELKHGPISMLEPGVAVIAIAPSGPLEAKMESSIRECKARQADLVVLSDMPLMEAEGVHSLTMPTLREDLVPLYYILPLQLLAYYMTVELGRDPDKPRNLAKSVTVE